MSGQRLKRYGFSLEEIQSILAISDNNELKNRLRQQEKAETRTTGDGHYFERASDIEVFIGIKEKDKADVVMEPVECAMTVHRGGYSTLSEAYGAIVSWITDKCSHPPVLYR